MRIVSLLPSATELVGELGLAEQLVAVSHECDQPPSVQRLPRATGSILADGLSQGEINEAVAEAVQLGKPLYTVDGELLRWLQPDLILTQGLCEVCAVTPQTIEASLRGVSCVLPATTQILSLTGSTIEGVFDDLRALARHTDSWGRAEERIVEAQERWARLSTATSTKRVLLLEWIEPPYSPGHWVPQQIEAAGLISAIGEPGDHSRALSWEEIEQSQPDAIGVICCGYGLADNRRWARQLLDVPSVNAWFDGPLYAFDANRSFSRPTLALLDGAEQLHHAFVLEQTEGDGFCREA